jgi:hypothetical protein
VTDDLVAFLRARLDEDEQVAEALRGVRFHAYEEGGDDGWAIESDPDGDPGAIVGERALAEHIARWDPARVLAEVTAKRRIISLFSHASPHSVMSGQAEREDFRNGWQFAMWDALPLLAVPYASHPDYRAEWAPTEEPAS